MYFQILKFLDRRSAVKLFSINPVEKQYFKGYAPNGIILKINNNLKSRKKFLRLKI